MTEALSSNLDQCMVWYGMVWYGMVWYGMVWYGMVWYGMVWYGIWYGIWYGMVWYGMVWYKYEIFLPKHPTIYAVTTHCTEFTFKILCRWNN